MTESRARLMRARSFAVSVGASLVAVGLALSTEEAGWAADDRSEKPLKAALRAIMSQIDDNELAPWEPEDSHMVTEPNSGAYKVVRTDGSIEFIDERPASSAGVSKLYGKQNPEGFALVLTDQGRQFEWVRLYWHPDKRKWTRPHPNLSVFQREQGLVEQVLSKLTHGVDSKAAYRIPILVAAIKRNREPDGAEQDRAELTQLLSEIGRGWGGGGLLNQVYDLNIRMGGRERRGAAGSCERAPGAAETHRCAHQQVACGPSPAFPYSWRGRARRRSAGTMTSTP